MKIKAKFDFTWSFSIKWNIHEPYVVWLLHKPRNYKKVRRRNQLDREIKERRQELETIDVYEM